jgi:alpha-beta hydrolase superfamily lysophospholipase
MRLKIFLTAFFLLAAFLLGSAWMFGSQLIEPANHPVTLPAGFEARMVSIPGAGRAVAGWWVDEGQGSPVVLLVHGIRADRLSMVTRAQLLTSHGFSVLLIDLQAHGETPGAAITLGYRESADVVAARDWIRRTAPGRRMGVIGVSLGGASVLLAPQPLGFDAVVLEAVFPRVGLAVENRVRIRLGPLAPVLTPLLLLQLRPRLHLSESELEPIRSIGQLAAPVLIVAGSRDEHTTLPESRELFAAAAEPKSIWVVEGARHQDFLQYDRAGYESNVLQFLTHYLSPAAFADDRARLLSETTP